MNKDTKKNLFIIGDIEDNMTKEILKSLLDDPDINDLKTLNIFIETIGGDLHCCFAILDAIEYLKEQIRFKINTFGIGKVYSAGFFIFLLGDYRKLFPSTRVFVHEHLILNDEASPFTAKLKEFEEDRNLHQIYTTYVMRRLDITSRQARTLLKKNKWLTTKDIEKYNITTEA